MFKSAFTWIGSYLLIFAAVALFAYGMWRLERWINYSADYKEQVQKEIKSMVKPECLIDK